MISCPICYDSILQTHSAISTQCGHLFCAECMIAHRKSSNLCPVCRCDITQVIRLRLQGRREELVTLPPQAVSCSHTLLQALEDASTSTETPLTSEEYRPVLESIREFVDMMDVTLAGTTVQALLCALKEQLTIIKNAEWRLQEEKILDGQLKRWSTLVASEEEILRSTELIYECYKQQRLGQDDETRQLLMDLDEVSSRIQQEQREHMNTITDLSETLTTLPKAPE